MSIHSRLSFTFSSHAKICGSKAVGHFGDRKILVSKDSVKFHEVDGSDCRQYQIVRSLSSAVILFTTSQIFSRIDQFPLNVFETYDEKQIRKCN